VADLVTVGGNQYMRRNPWGVLGLTIITLGVYFFVWYYKINRELRDYGIEVDPTGALLAVLIGWIIIIPPFVSFYRTADRILQAQEKSGASERISPLLGLLLFIFVSFLAYPYYQTQLNKVWDVYAGNDSSRAGLPPQPPGTVTG
jgi:drug/metabolite transporter (DMT)-like permease